jgi:hypothetical protein
MYPHMRFFCNAMFYKYFMDPSLIILTCEVKCDQRAFCKFTILLIASQTFLSEQTAPFSLGVISTTATQAGSIGFSLVYNQIPCS